MAKLVALLEKVNKRVQSFGQRRVSYRVKCQVPEATKEYVFAPEARGFGVRVIRQ